MMIDWMLWATIGSPIIALFIGVGLNRMLESRPKLQSYFGHIASFTVVPPNGNQTIVNTHAVVIRNVGRRAALDVRLHHFNLPDFSIYPAVPFTTETLADGSVDIVVPKLVPKKELTVSYLYFPPMTYAAVNNGIDSEDGAAKQIPVLMQRVFPKWFNVSVFVLFIVGLITVLYWIILAVGKWLWPVL